MNRIACGVIAVAAGCCSASPVSSGQRADLALHDVRVFDGAQVLEHQTVLVGDGRILALGPAGITIPPGATVVEGAGATLVPGLVDSHAHVNYDEDPVDALAAGVTSEVDMMSPPSVSVRLARDGVTAHARVFPAGNVATAPGGHGTEYGHPIPTLTTPGEAEAFVAARVAEGSHHLKIIIENGDEISRSIPTLDGPTVHALVEAAHAHHLLAVAHVGSAADVDVALAGGVDGLVHVPGQPLSPAEIAAIAARHLFVAPTLTVLGSVCHRETGAKVAADPRLAPLLMPRTVANLKASWPSFPHPKLDCDAPAQTVAALHAAGVPILAGTDAPNRGTAHGASVHDELEQLVAAGLTPTEALVAATSAPAHAFGLTDLGEIRVGALADLLLVDGDPTRDITQSRAIRAVWREGHAFDLDARRAAVTAAQAVGGLVSDFGDGAPATRFGQAWTTATDQPAGGSSVASISVRDGALSIDGEVGPGRDPWSGAWFVPGATATDGVDLSGPGAAVSLRARGDPGKYAVMLFRSGSMGGARQTIDVGPTWQTYRLPFTAFGLAGTDIRGLFVGSKVAGRFHLEIDDVTLGP
jgi:imidazolonepropionase-like amidohydrolase